MKASTKPEALNALRRALDELVEQMQATANLQDPKTIAEVDSYIAEVTESNGILMEAERLFKKHSDIFALMNKDFERKLRRVEKENMIDKAILNYEKKQDDKRGGSDE